MEYLRTVAVTRLALGGTGAGGGGTAWDTCVPPPSTADAEVTATEQAAPASATATTNARAILIKATPRSFVTAAMALCPRSFGVCTTRARISCVPACLLDPRGGHDGNRAGKKKEPNSHRPLPR